MFDRIFKRSMLLIIYVLYWIFLKYCHLDLEKLYSIIKGGESNWPERNFRGPEEELLFWWKDNNCLLDRMKWYFFKIHNDFLKKSADGLLLTRMSLLLKCIDYTRWKQPIYGLTRHCSKYFKKEKYPKNLFSIRKRKDSSV